MSDSEYEEERVLAMVELQGIMNSEILYDEKPAKILEPESEHPVLQFGNYIFRGEWEETMGTVVCFDVPSAEDKEKDNAYKYSVKTDKKLSLQRVFLEEKPKDIQQPSKEHSSSTSKTQACNGTDDLSVAGTSNGGFEKPEIQESCKMHEEINDVLMDIIARADLFAAATSVLGVMNGESQQQSQIIDTVSASTESCNLPSARASVSVETSANSPVSNDLSSAQQDQDPSPSRNGELTSEPEERSLGSSEADFIVLSEVDCSNEASCEAGGATTSGEFKEPVGSTEGVGSSLANMKHFSLHRVDNSSASDSREETSANVTSGSNPVAGVVRSLLTDIQHKDSHDGEASTSQIFPDDVADSASSLGTDMSRQRQSESSLPLICDSALGEGVTVVPLHVDDQIEGSEEMDVSGADCSDVSQISTSGGVGLATQYPDVFEDEAMDTTENVNAEHHLRNFMIPSDSEAMDVSLNHGLQQPSNEASETYEKNEAICLEPGPSTSSGITRKRIAVKTTDASVSNSAEGNDSHISHSSTYVISQDYRRSKDSGLIDSTSNKVSCIKRNSENTLRSVPGIDSTTNDSGKKQSIGEEASENNSSTSALNERIDSTMNNMNIAVPVEHVDFEMREATNMTEIEEFELSDDLSIEEDAPPIDSTSSVQRLETYQCAAGNVSDSSAVVLQESPRQSHMESLRNNSPCNVTESHIDDHKPLSSFVISSPGNYNTENEQFEVTESSEGLIEHLQIVTESDLHDHGNISESSFQDDSHGASSSQAAGPCASTSHEIYEVVDELEAEDDSINQVTESRHACNYSSTYVESMPSGHEVTDSTNISYPSQPASEDLDDEPLVIVEDSSVCEVTESSSSCRGEGILVIDENSSNDGLDSHETGRPHSQQYNESPSSAGVASGSDVTESSRFKNTSFFRVQDHNSSSGDAKEPSSSGLNTSEAQVFEACSSADVISSAENEMFYYSSAASHDLSTNEASMSSASSHWVSPLNLLVQASEYEVSNSSEQNADSTEGDNRQSPSNQDEEPEGSDNSKLPSSTSN